MSTTSTITVKKATQIGVGIRVWFVIQDIDGNIYQRWSNDGNTTDQVLMVTRPDDVLTIEFGEGPSHSLAKVSTAPNLSPFNSEEIPTEPTNIIIAATFA